MAKTIIVVDGLALELTRYVSPLAFEEHSLSGMFKSDSAATANRIVRLQTYFKKAVLDGDHFICRHASACKSSHRGVFYQGQLPHIGHHYDLYIDDCPIRVVVVGQEYGHNPIHVSMGDRHRMIVRDTGLGRRFRREGSYRARNPHMRGTTSLLRLAFGLGLGSDHASEFLYLSEGRVHIFDAFALVNFLLCSAVPLGSAAPSSAFDAERFKGAGQGCSTAEMQRNCARHFRETLRILEPTLVVAQGAGVRSWLKQSFEINALNPAPLEALRIDSQWVPLLGLTHPSAHFPGNWGANDRTPYLLEIVAPAVALALGRQDAPLT